MKKISVSGGPPPHVGSVQCPKGFKNKRETYKRMQAVKNYGTQKSEREIKLCQKSYEHSGFENNVGNFQFLKTGKSILKTNEEKMCYRWMCSVWRPCLWWSAFLTTLYNLSHLTLGQWLPSRGPSICCSCDDSPSEGWGKDTMDKKYGKNTCTGNFCWDCIICRISQRFIHFHQTGPCALPYEAESWCINW